MAIKKNELYSALWKSCDELRGGMDASQYADHVLALLFVKYASDKNEAEISFPIEVPEGGSFKGMVSLKGKKDIGEGINIIIKSKGFMASAGRCDGIYAHKDIAFEIWRKWGLYGLN